MGVPKNGCFIRENPTKIDDRHFTCCAAQWLTGFSDWWSSCLASSQNSQMSFLWIWNPVVGHAVMPHGLGHAPRYPRNGGNLWLVIIKLIKLGKKRLWISQQQWHSANKNTNLKQQPSFKKSSEALDPSTILNRRTHNSTSCWEDSSNQSP